MKNNLKIVKEIYSGAKALDMAVIKSPIEAYTKGDFLPYLSEILPEENEPII